MMEAAMGKKVLGGALGALEAALGMARHVAWYVSYHLDGKTREDGPAEDR
jgi:hypothetical protein